MHGIALPGHAYSEPLFVLPTGSVEQTYVNQHPASLLLRLVSCCRGGGSHQLVLDVDAPSGWLQWGPTGLAGPLRISLSVTE